MVEIFFVQVDIRNMLDLEMCLVHKTAARLADVRSSLSGFFSNCLQQPKKKLLNNIYEGGIASSILTEHLPAD